MAAANPWMRLGGALGLLSDCRCPAFHALRPRPPFNEARAYAAAAPRQPAALARTLMEFRCELLRLGERETDLGQAGLLVAFGAGKLSLDAHAKVSLRRQLRHRPTLNP